MPRLVSTSTVVARWAGPASFNHSVAWAAASCEGLQRYSTVSLKLVAFWLPSVAVRLRNFAFKLNTTPITQRIDTWGHPIAAAALIDFDRSFTFNSYDLLIINLSRV